MPHIIPRLLQRRVIVRLRLLLAVVYGDRMTVQAVDVVSDLVSRVIQTFLQWGRLQREDACTFEAIARVNAGVKCNCFVVLGTSMGFL